MSNNKIANRRDSYKTRASFAASKSASNGQLARAPVAARSNFEIDLRGYFVWAKRDSK